MKIAVVAVLCFERFRSGIAKGHYSHARMPPPPKLAIDYTSYLSERGNVNVRFAGTC